MNKEKRYKAALLEIVAADERGDLVKFPRDAAALAQRALGESVCPTCGRKRS